MNALLKWGPFRKSETELWSRAPWRPFQEMGEIMSRMERMLDRAPDGTAYPQPLCKTGSFMNGQSTSKLEYL